MEAGGRAASARQGKLFFSLMMETFCRNKTGSHSRYQKDSADRMETRAVQAQCLRKQVQNRKKRHLGFMTKDKKQSTAGEIKHLCKCTDTLHL